MQKVVYKCDHCGEEIGDNKHISLRFSNASGIAVPPKSANMFWGIIKSLQGKFVHFCNPTCLRLYFVELMKPTKTTK